MKKKTHLRGGTDTERLYLESLDFTMPNGEKAKVKKTKSKLRGYDMEDHIARHKGRYSLLSLYARPGQKILDFPSGSGYASEIAHKIKAIYEGRDFDDVTIEYAKRVYGGKNAVFKVGDLTNPVLSKSHYDAVFCIEGIEHIPQQFQKPLVAKLAEAVKPGGVLVVSSPENPAGVSGPSAHNKDHLWELTRADFLEILSHHFPVRNIEVISHTAMLSTGVRTTCLYAICHKPK